MSTPSPTAYDFLAPPRICFGWGRRREIGELVAREGKRAWVVHGSRTLETSGRLDEILETLAASGIDCEVLGRISREPEVDDVDRLAALLRDRLPRGSGAADGDVVVAIGGGSAIDLAKATSALVTQDGVPAVRDYLEGVGKGLRLTKRPLPVIAVPTTSGTGSEATKNAVISSYDPAFKKSLRSDLMMPRAVLLDPELTVSVPPATTAHTGMDAITQLIESYVSRRAKPLPRALALHGLELAAPAIVKAVNDGMLPWAREDMAHAALLSGMALANSGLGMAHGVAAALGVHARVPHGLACAVMLPVAMRVNRAVCETEMGRIGEVLTRRVWPTAAAAADAAVDAVEGLCVGAGIPLRLSEIGVREEQLDSIVASSRGNSMSGNPRELSDEELRDVLGEIL